MSEEKVLTKEIADEIIIKEKDSVFLYLDEFTQIDDQAAEVLAKRQGVLSLSGLTELSDNAAESLSKHKDSLRLDGLTELSDAAAESLSKHKGSLSLDGLNELSDAAAESLAKNPNDLSLKGLTTLGNRAVEIFSNRYCADYFPEKIDKEIKAMRGPITKEIAEQFLKDETPDLSCFATIDDEASELLASYEGDLCLDGLTELSDSGAESLSKHSGFMSIDNGWKGSILDLSSKAAEFLAKHKSIETENKEIKNFSGKALGFEIKNYQRISPTNADGETLSVNCPGGVFTDEADFIFDGVQIHIAVVENNAGRKIFINHKYTVEDMNDQFVKLFTDMIADKLVEGLEDGLVDLEGDWFMDVEEIEKIAKHYPEFLRKHKNEGGSQADSDDPISALNQELEIALNKKDKHKSGESKLSTDEFRALLNQIVDLKDQIETLSCPEQSRINSMLKQIDGNK